MEHSNRRKTSQQRNILISVRKQFNSDTIGRYSLTFACLYSDMLSAKGKDDNILGLSALFHPVMPRFALPQCEATLFLSTGLESLM